MKKFALSVALAVSILFLPSASQAYLLDGVQQFNGHYYKVFDFGMTWDDAKIFCENLGGHLVTITSQQEQNFVNRMIADYGNKKYYWFGASKDSFKNWNWVNGEQINYKNWQINQPDNKNGHENAIMTYKDNFGWNDLNSDGYSGGMIPDFGLICEWDSPNSVKVRY